MRIVKLNVSGQPGITVDSPRRIQDTRLQSQLDTLQTIERANQRVAQANEVAALSSVSVSRNRSSIAQQNLQIANERAKLEAEAQRQQAKLDAERAELMQDNNYALATESIERLKLSFAEGGGSRQQFVTKATEVLNSFDIGADARRSLLGDVFGVASDNAEKQAKKREDFIEEVRDAQRQADTSQALLQLTDLGAQLSVATGGKRAELLSRASEFVNGYLNNQDLDSLTQLEVANGAFRYLLPYLEDSSQLAVDINRWTQAQQELTQVQYDPDLSPTERQVLEQQIRVRNGFSANPVLTDIDYDISNILEFEETQRDYRRFRENTTLEAQLINDAAIGQLARQYMGNPTPLRVRCRQSGESGICTAADLAEQFSSFEEEGFETQSQISRIDSQIAALEGSRARDIASMVRRAGSGEDPVVDPLLQHIQQTSPELGVVMGLMRQGRGLTPEQEALLRDADEQLIQARNRQIQSLQVQREAAIGKYQLQQGRLAPYLGGPGRAAAASQFGSTPRGTSPTVRPGQ